MTYIKILIFRQNKEKGFEVKVYLSVDLDFWNDKRFPQKYFDQLINLGKPLIIVRQHHYLLKHIRKFENQFDTLVNIDYHSDITDRCEGKTQFSRQCYLNCGTWVNHIKGNNKRYIWSYPQKVCVLPKWHTGYCHCYTNPFTCGNTYEVCRWSFVEKRYRWFPKMEDVIAIGISISPGWSDLQLIRDFKKWFINNEIGEKSDAN
jgi:hypothetical protein